MKHTNSCTENLEMVVEDFSKCISIIQDLRDDENPRNDTREDTNPLKNYFADLLFSASQALLRVNISSILAQLSNPAWFSTGSAKCLE